MKTLFTLFVCILSISAFAATKNLSDESVKADDTLTLSKDTTYILTEKVFVESGAVLNIQAGTVIKATEGTGDDASALIICRGGKIYANGTKYNPIIFTAESDNFGNLSSSDKGLWGGLVILGNAVTNEGEAEIEGIAPGDPRSEFGGDDDDDNSGVLRYVSVRHSGTTIAPDNELNGISMGAVGSGTVFEYIEAYASSDDGIEWFGGSVNGSHIVCAFCDDDGFDIDQGFHGNLQFLFCIQDSIADEHNANWAGEWDGDDTKGAEPYGDWTIYNATFIGGGKTANSSNAGIILRANAGAKVYNSVFMNFKKDRGIVVEDKQDDSQDSRKRFDDGDIKFGNNIFWNVGGASSLEEIVRWYYKDEDGDSHYPAAADLLESVEDMDNSYTDPELTAVAYGAKGKLNPLPKDDSPVYDDLADYPDDFFTEVSYKGAFDKDPWIALWTGLWDENILAAVEEPETPEKVLHDDDINEDEELTLSKDTIYILSEKVFVEDGAELTIEAGTIIKAVEETGDNAAALVICRGGKIMAEGTAEEPIIFTALSDDLDDPEDLTNLDKGLWGGVVLLGNAETNEGEAEIEGIAPGDPRSLFGGDDDEDNSGIMQYVSIRHSGTTIAPDNELNGLSLGGIGSGTTLDHIEVFASSDDGYEWWGGKVNAKHLIAAFCDDDAFDIDQGYRGNLQYIFSIQDSIADNMNANWAGEWDGDDTKGAKPYGFWAICNATFIGGGENANSSNAVVIMRANASGRIRNSIFTNFKKDRGVVIEDKQDDSQDSRKQFDDGKISFTNNIFWNIGDAEDIESICHWYYKDEDGKSQYPLAEELVDSMSEWESNYEDPQLTSIGYGAGDYALDPRPAHDGPAFDEVYPIKDHDFLYNATFKGAFANDNWADGWSFLSQGGYFAEDFIGVQERSFSSRKVIVTTFSANIRKNQLTISYALPEAGDVSFNLFNLGGKQITRFMNGYRKAGMHQLTADLSDVASGTYICNLKAGSQVLSHRITINK